MEEKLKVKVKSLKKSVELILHNQMILDMKYKNCFEFNLKRCHAM